MNVKTAILLALLGMPFGAALAQDPYQSESTSRPYGHAPISYTLGDVRVLAEDPDGGDDAEGVRLAGSYLLQHNVFLRGALMSAGSDGRYGNDTESFEIGAGMRHPASSTVDLVGMASIVRVEREFGRSGTEADDWGPSLLGGVRAGLAPRIEVGGFVGFTETFGDNVVSLLGEGLYHFTPNLSAVAGLALSNDVREANLGARWNFR